MKKIFNWTFGSIFRTLGRIITYLLIGGLITLICVKNDIKITQLLGFEVVNAKTFTTTENYRVRLCQAQCACDCEYNSWTSNGTSTSIASSKIPDGLSMNFGTNDVFYSGVTYRVAVSFDYTGSLYYANNPYNFTCFGGTTNSTSGGEESNIQTCQAVGNIIGNNNITFVYDVTPLVDIKSIKINTYFSAESWTSVKGNTSKSKVTIDTSTSDAINNQTTNIINNNNQNTQDIIDNQNELLGTKCSNLLNPTTSTTTHRGITFTPHLENGTTKNFTVNGTRTSGSNAWAVIGNLNIKKGTKVKVYTSDEQVGIQLWDTNNNTGIINNGVSVTYNNYTFTQSYSNVEISIWTSKQNVDNVTIYVMISEETMTYCKYGSYVSKQDETTQSINDLKDSINDDNLNDSDIADKLKFDNITDNSLGPFATFLTIPLTWVQNILASNQVCRDIVLPLPYTNTNLTLPCMTEFWSKLGLLGSLVSALWLCVVGVRIFNGLFLLTVDTISSKDNEDELTKIKSWEL